MHLSVPGLIAICIVITVTLRRYSSSLQLKVEVTFDTYCIYVMFGGIVALGIVLKTFWKQSI